MKWSDARIKAYLLLTAVASLAISVLAGARWGG
jgi:hypothetical protein